MKWPTQGVEINSMFQSTESVKCGKKGKIEWLKNKKEQLTIQTPRRENLCMVS